MTVGSSARCIWALPASASSSRSTVGSSGVPHHGRIAGLGDDDVPLAGRRVAVDRQRERRRRRSETRRTRPSLVHVTPLIDAVTPTERHVGRAVQSVTAAASLSTSAAWSRDSSSSSPHPVTSDTVTSDIAASAIETSTGAADARDGRSRGVDRTAAVTPQLWHSLGTTATRDGWGAASVHPSRIVNLPTGTQPIGTVSATTGSTPAGRSR